MFFSNSIANKKGFLHRPARFRGWTQSVAREAGSYQSDAIRNITGSACFGFDSTQGASMNGAFTVTRFDSTLNNVAGGNLKGYRADMDVSRVVPTSTEVQPKNAAVPVIAYLGLNS